MARALAAVLLLVVPAVCEDANCSLGSCNEDSSLLQVNSTAAAPAPKAALLEVLTAAEVELGVSQRFIESAIDRVSTPVFFAGFAAFASVVGAYLIYRLEHVKVPKELNGSFSSERWWLIVSTCLVEVAAGSIFAMGAWQDALRDSLNISMKSLTLIGAAAFMGAIAAPAGGIIYDTVGPKAAVVLGSSFMAIGYSLMGLATVAGDSLSPALKVLLAAVGSLAAGYSSISLLDNIVCMACSESFPQNRAAVVGYAKASLATGGGLWALLWVHVFNKPAGLGLPCYLAFMAIGSFGICLFSLAGTKVLPAGAPRQKFDFRDLGRLSTLIAMLSILAVYDVMVSFFFSAGSLQPSPVLGYTGIALQMLPLIILLTVPRYQSADELHALKEEASSPVAEARGLPFHLALRGLDFWLVLLCQFAVFGGGVATNQNLALILESAQQPSASGLGVAIFALTSALSRVAVGILSDKYNARFDRFNWLTATAATATLGQLLVSLMDIRGIMLGTLLMGLAFGAFYTVIVPVVNEMYGSRDFGKIWGTQIVSQALSSFLICFQLLPVFYHRAAAGGADKCTGAGCFRMSFVLLAMLNAAGLAAAFLLQVRNASSMPMTRMAAREDAPSASGK